MQWATLRSSFSAKPSWKVVGANLYQTLSAVDVCHTGGIRDDSISDERRLVAHCGACQHVESGSSSLTRFFPERI